MAVYRNPIVRGVNPDPSICRVGEDYYLATSTFHLVPGVPIYHSRDLINWSLIGHALTRSEQFCMDDRQRIEIYAPTLRYHGGTFYMITTNVLGRGNFYVTATDPAGKWSDPIVVDAELFDPSLLFDDDGTVYYTRRGPIQERTIVQAPIDLATGKLLAPLRAIAKGFVSDDCEGPHLYKIRGIYYLLTAEGGSRYLHMVCVGRSDHPYGPFEKCPHNPILTQLDAWWRPVKTIGHAEFVEAHDGSWWCAFLATRHHDYGALAHLGRESFITPMTWKDGWPVIDKRRCWNLTIDAPTLPLTVSATPAEHDDFDESALRDVYVRLGPAKPFSLTERPGWLTLHATGPSLAPPAPSAFVGRRQADLAGSVETTMDFTPREGDEAGLCAFQTCNYAYELVVASRHGARVALFRRRVGDIAHESPATRIASGPLKLRVDFTPDHYRFSIESAAGRHEFGSAMTRLISTDVADTWCGMVIGVFATSSDPASAAPAAFDDFVYRGEDLPVTDGVSRSPAGSPSV